MAWPDEFEGIKGYTYSEWGIEKLEILQEFSEGRSGARVFYVDIESQAFDGQGILKLCRIEEYEGEADTEDHKLTNIHDNPNTFTEDHIPRLEAKCKTSHSMCILTQIAGGSVLHVTPFAKINTYERKKECIEKVSYELLQEWNSDYFLSESAESPVRALKAWLGYRIKPEMGGAIHDFVDNELQLDPNDQSYRINGEAYPNPLAYSLHPELWHGCSLKLIRGRQHGDLHDNNILVSIPPSIRGDSIKDYYIIDFDIYNENTYLFYDHAYFEISYLINAIGHVVFSRWKSMMEVLASPDVLGTGYKEIRDPDVGPKNLIKAARLKIEEWCKENEESRLDHLRGQNLLARTAAGLNFVNKKSLPDIHRTYSFIYASYQLKRFLTNFKISWGKKGKSIRVQKNFKAPKNDSWKKVWNYVNQFDNTRGSFILILSDSEGLVDDSEYSVLGDIPWSLIVAFEGDTAPDCLLNSIGERLEHTRPSHVMSSENRRDISYDRSTCWLRVNYSDIGGERFISSYHDWRRQYSSAITNIAGNLYRQVKPSPIKVLILSNGIDTRRLRTVWERMDDVFREDADYAIVKSEDRQTDFEGITEAPNVETFTCSAQNLISGLWQMLGSPTTGERVIIPTRGDGDESSRTRTRLSNEDYRYLSEDLEIVHSGLSNVDDNVNLGQDFWRGHEITWQEISLSVDLERDIFSEMRHRLQSVLSQELKDNRTKFMSFAHKPGAGATTIAKRLAWSFKDHFPTVFLRHESPDTDSRIDELYQTSDRLPVLIFAEQADTSREYCIQLLRRIAAQGARSVLIYIKRQQNLTGDFVLDTPLSPQEARRFHRHYSSFADPEGQKRLNRLMEAENTKYWSPFFFGFYAFGEQFQRIPDFVKSCISNADEKIVTLLKYLSLISRYSEDKGLRYNDVKKFMGISMDRRISIDDLFGKSSSNLIIHRDNIIKVVHPIIAEEVLRNTLSVDNGEISKKWRDGIPTLSIDFIRDMTKIRGRESEALMDTLKRVFIARDSSRQFSELIHEVESSEGQHRILRELTSSCPDNPHFWTHLARHYMYEMESVPDDLDEDVESTFGAAKLCAGRAIELDEENADHHHALGMAYRLQAVNRLRRCASKGADPLRAVREVEKVVERAEEKFNEATRLAPNSIYGNVAYIEMIASAISILFRMSDCSDYASFLSHENRVSEWCRDKLHVAEELLSYAKRQDKGRETSEHLRTCEIEVSKFYEGDLAKLIESLSSLLDKKKKPNPSIRRTAANAYLQRVENDWSSLSTEELRRIYELIDPTLHNFDSTPRDLFIWLQSYRRLPEFDIIRALDELKIWNNNNDDINSLYYTYLLYFIQWQKSALDDPETINNYVSRCEEVAMSKGFDKTFSHEWWSSSPEWCPIVHHKEMEWDNSRNFFKDTSRLSRLGGHIKNINGPQSGTVSVGPFDAFFLPGNDFRSGKDEGTDVELYLGFSYSGLRAWDVINADS